MDKKQLLEFINLFRDKAEKNKLIIFVGAGVSCNVKGMPSWYTLIQKMAQAINYSRCSSCRFKCKCTDKCLLSNEYTMEEYLKIPQYVFNKSRKKYKEVVRENISDDVIDAPLSSAIFDINPVHIITTNYDKLIESSSNEFCKQYQVVVKDKDLLNSVKSKYIIKMHGDVSYPETIVLKEQDYLNYSQNHVLIELFLKSLLTDHTILFWGYSLNDYNIKLILSWLNYMRTQNKALPQRQRVGYIVLDDEKISRTQSTYFTANNIGVINIKEMPLISDIPVKLSDEKGQRLYSFLKTISDPSLEEFLSSSSSIDFAVNFMTQYAFIDYKMLLKLLYIKQYEKTETQLHLLNENDYNLLEQYICNNENPNSYQLKHLFINAGVETIFFVSDRSNKSFRTGDIRENRLFCDELFVLYIQNKYDELASRLENLKCNLMDKYFYTSIIYGYSEVISNYNIIPFAELSLDNQVAFLHNTGALEILQKNTFDSNKKIIHFIQNIALTKERDMFSSYLDIYDGNSKKRLSIKNSLEKLKSDISSGTINFGRTSCSEIYNIKNEVISQYNFYFLNHIFFNGFSDIKTFFKTYIEAMLFASTEQAEKPTDFWGKSFDNRKYFMSIVDFDIITKFIEPKDLFNLINTYKVVKFNTSQENILSLCHCFENLCYSLTKAKTYGYNQSSIKTFLNLAQVLKLVNLTNENKPIIEESMVTLLYDQFFIKLFFSISNYNFRLSIKVVSDLCKLLTFKPDISIIRNIIYSNDFYTYASNVNFECLRNFIMSWGTELLIDKQNEIGDIIEAQPEFNKKIILLRLLFKCITNEVLKNKYVAFLSSNFSKLDTYSLYDFVFNHWVKPSIEEIDYFLKGIIDIYNKQIEGIQSIPDPVETHLECAYILYIAGIIPDINILSVLAEGRPHLQFLLNPNNFDYSRVDFSNYMWENFARHEKYMKLFIEHKSTIIPGIETKINDGSASETEKKILYGFLLSGKEIWNF